MLQIQHAFPVSWYPLTSRGYSTGLSRKKIQTAPAIEHPQLSGGVFGRDPLIFVFFFPRPDASLLSSGIIIGIWRVSMILDLQVTFARRTHIPKHESGIVLFFAYRKLPPAAAALLTAGIVCVCVLFLPVVFFFGTDIGGSTVIAYFFFALLHAVAVPANEKFVR